MPSTMHPPCNFLITVWEEVKITFAENHPDNHKY